MAAAAGYSINIRAVDGATGVIGKVNAKLGDLGKFAARVQAPVTQLSNSLGRFGDVSGLNRVASGMGEVQRRIGMASATLGRFAPALAGLASAATIGGIGDLIRQFTVFGSALGLSAQRAGLQADALHDMQGAARLAGSSAEALTSGITTLGDNLTNAVAGRAPQVVQLMAQLGLSFTDAFGHARTASQVLPEIADRIARLQNPTQRAMIATQMFGSAGESLIPFLMRGSAGIEEYNQQAERYGLINSEGVRRANEMRLAQTRLSMAFEGLGYSVAEKVAPILAPLLDRLANYIAQNGPDIAAWFERIAKSIELWANSGGAQHMLDTIGRIATTIQGAVDSVGGWSTVVEGFLALLIGSKILGAIANVGGLAAAFRSLMGSFVGRAALTGLAAHEGLAAVDPTDRVGSWIDQHVPGAAALDNWFARHTGLGRTYEQQRSAAPAASSSTAPTDMSLPRGIRNNNPLNLEFRGQEGSIGSDGRFGRYGTMQSGVAAGLRQLLLYQDRDHLMTVAAMVGRWAPSSEPGNHTDAYAAQVAAALGVDPNAPINLHDPQIAARMIASMALRENGRAVDPLQVQQGVASVLGTPVQRFGLPMHDDPTSWPVAPAVSIVPAAAPIGAPGAPGPNGQATVRLTFENPPPGLRGSSVSQGGVHVEMPTLGNTP